MTDTLDLGPTPADEDCEQVGTFHYDSVRAQAECRAWINQLTREFSPLPDGVRLSISSNPHDFGVYYEVVVKFSDDDEAAIDFAIRMENEASPVWDAEARKELGLTAQKHQ